MAVEAAYSAALENACRGNDFGAAMAEVNAGANPAQQDVHGYTPLHYVCLGGDEERRVELARWLLSLPAGRATLNSAAKRGSTPLLAAAAWGNYLLVQMLLEYGANMGARDSKGKSAEDKAREGSHWEVLHLLESKCLPSSFPHSALTPCLQLQ